MENQNLLEEAMKIQKENGEAELLEWYKALTEVQRQEFNEQLKETVSNIIDAFYEFFGTVIESATALDDA